MGTVFTLHEYWDAMVEGFLRENCDDKQNEFIDTVMDLFYEMDGFTYYQRKNPEKPHSPSQDK